jgi:hypothetical protein
MKKCTSKQPLDSNEIPEVGDLIQSFDGPFGTGIVVKVTETDVYIERPMMQIVGPTDTIMLHTERYSISIITARSSSLFWRRSVVEKDNRHYYGS